MRNPKALKFREETKLSIAKLPKIDYSLTGENQIRQVYYLPDQGSLADMPLGAMNDEERLALLTMREIGKFGHPLVREAMKLV